MRGLFLPRPERGTVPITVLRASSLAKFLAGESVSLRRWVKESGFDASPETVLTVPGPDGRLARVLVGIGAGETPWAYAGLREKLPAGSYAFDVTLPQEAATRAALGWALDSHKLDPALVPAAAIAVRLYGAENALRRAWRVAAKSWALSPHPDLAEGYAHLK